MHIRVEHSISRINCAFCFSYMLAFLHGFIWLYVCLDTSCRLSHSHSLKNDFINTKLTGGDGERGGGRGEASKLVLMFETKRLILRLKQSFKILALWQKSHFPI